MKSAPVKEKDDAHYVQSTRALASTLRCKCIDFPGQHDVSFYMPQEFSNAIRSTQEQRHDRKNYEQ
jgi:hypothetical protein